MDVTIGSLKRLAKLIAGQPSNLGTFTCNGATGVVVADTNVTANSVIVVTLKTVGGTVGAIPRCTAITAGTGFTVTGTASDTSIYNYRIIG